MKTQIMVPIFYGVLYVHTSEAEWKPEKCLRASIQNTFTGEGLFTPTLVQPSPVGEYQPWRLPSQRPFQDLFH